MKAKIFKKISSGLLYFVQHWELKADKVKLQNRKRTGEGGSVCCRGHQQGAEKRQFSWFLVSKPDSDY